MPEWLAILLTILVLFGGPILFVGAAYLHAGMMDRKDEREGRPYRRARHYMGRF